MNDYRIPHNPIFDNPKNFSSISNESPHPTKKEKKKIKKTLLEGVLDRVKHFSKPLIGPCQQREPARVLPHLETQSVFAAGPVLPTGTDLPERVELAQHPSRTGYEVLEYQRCPPRPWNRTTRRMNQAARLGEARRGEEKSGEKRRVVGSAVTEARGGGCGRGVGEGDSEEVERGEPGERSTSASPSSSLPMLWRGGGEGGEGRRRGPAAESERGARAESALGPSFRCRRQWQSQFLVASACRRRRGAPSV